MAAKSKRARKASTKKPAARKASTRKPSARPKRSSTRGPGIVYSDPRREALARRFGRL